MALIACPECNGKVSTRAAACPHCELDMKSLARCPACGTYLPPGDSNCMECATPMDIACPDCSAILMVGRDDPCPECGCPISELFAPSV